MLVARIEIWPFGSYRERRGIGTLKVANLGPVEDRIDKTMYAAVYEVRNRVRAISDEKWAYVEHDREDGAGVLVSKALQALLR